MTVYIFLGPTMAVAEARGILDAEYLPPVAQGDVCRIARDASAIGIIDGYFHNVPAVWHKEILWALSEGVPVFGASSMGALRAAELAPFGMRGVGWIYEAFRGGTLEDDDEVAVLHSEPDADGEYRVFSEPMVNIRRTLAAAADAGVTTKDTAAGLIGIAKRLYYGDRDYRRILALAREAGLGKDAELGALEAWLGDHRIDQKRDDAIALLEAIAGLEAAAPAPAMKFTFERTELWQRLRSRVQTRSVAPAEAVSAPAGPPPTLDVEGQAMMRWLLLEVARAQHIEVDADALRATVLEFRRRAELWEPDQLVAWLDARGLSMPEFVALMEDEARIRGMLEWVRLESERLRPHVEMLAETHAREDG